MGGIEVEHHPQPCTKLPQVAKSTVGRLSTALSVLNRHVASSFLGRHFKLDARGTLFTTELRAGTATFLTMVYIISVNASILTASGGPCNPNTTSYSQCLSTTNKDLVVATATSSMLGSLGLGLLANLPLGLAPGMGSNAYFTYNMVGIHGSGPLNYETALTVVTLEGIIFLLISGLGLRSKIARAIPRPVRLASAAGIGLFLAFTGLQQHNGLGLIGPSQSTLVTLAACDRTDPVTGACLSGKMQSPTFWLGTVGFLITATCLSKKIKGSMILGILFVTLVSWFRHTPVTFFPDTPEGNSAYDYFKNVVEVHVIKSTAGKISFANFFGNSKIWIPLITLLYVDLLDTTASMYSMAEYAGFFDENTGGFEGEYRAFLVDAGTTIVSSALGSTTVTTYLESTAGIMEGGRTGLTAVTVGLYFMVSLLFTPLFVSVPAWAVGGSLVMVGVMMMRVVKEIEWGEMREGVPAFVTMTVMPMTYSIANGILAGIGVYVVMNGWDWGVRMVGWVRKVREMMKEAGKQVSAAGNGVSVEPAETV